jgi:hypothetical protein
MTLKTKYLMEELIGELRLISERMKKEQDISKKLYYYSAAYGSTNRILRIEFDTELLLADLVLNTAYGLVQSRLQAVMAGDRVVPLKQESIDELADCVAELADSFEDRKDCCHILQRIASIAFQTTGAGYYMSATGRIPAQK